ncbi:MAG: hypothetical protein CVV27_04190 [Candidatus Melainabacteria bacterium HGW-Melainabacteria-1]|nr:MAG: hypothetical protein CVV27_04190 [Candidatus Melainabacteria bacterium HGW-Melainabacteria-1]
MPALAIHPDTPPQDAFEMLLRMIAESRQNIGQNFYTLGQALAYIKDNRLYEVGGFNTFFAFLRDARVDIAAPDAERFIAITEDPAFERQLSMGLSKMLELMKLPETTRSQILTQGAEVNGQHKDIQEMNLRELRQASQQIKREGKTRCDRCRRWVDAVKELDGHFYGAGGAHSCYDAELEERRSLSAGRIPAEQLDQVLETLKGAAPASASAAAEPALAWLPESLYQVYGQLIQDQNRGEISRESLQREQEMLRKLVHLCQTRLQEIQQLGKALAELES